MAKKTCIFFLFCFLIFQLNISALYSQTLSRSIKWETVREIKNIEKTKYILDFQNARLYNSGLLPQYSENIDIQSYYDPSYNYLVKLNNAKFIAFENIDISKIEDLEKAPINPIIKSKVIFDRGKAFLSINFIPIKRDPTTNEYQKLVSFDLVLEKNKNPVKSIFKNKNASKSVLSSGTWKKIRLKESGIYKISFEEIESMGFSNPQNIRIFGNDSGWLPMIAGDDRPDDLIENDILIQDNSVIFFAHGANTWKYNDISGLIEPSHHYYSEYAYYFITTDYNSGYDNSIKNVNSETSPETHSVNTYNYFSNHEIDILNIAETGRRWYGESFDVANNQVFTFNAQNLLNNSSVNIGINTASTSGNSYFNISVNGTNEIVNFSQPNDYSFADRSSTEFTFNSGTSDDIIVNLEFISGSAAVQAWLDNIYINGQCDLSFTEGQMIFRNAEHTGIGNIIHYTLSNAGSLVYLWDITDPTKPKNINTQKVSNYQTFKLTGDVLREFVAFDHTSFLKPDLDNVTDVSNQNLHGTSGNTDMIIVTHPDFISQANELKIIHEARDGMSVKLVTSEQVYNEFSSGATDFSAIRDYVKMVYERAAADTLKYLLLFGDGSYDNRTGEGINGNFVITYQQDNSESLGYSYVTDDFFGMLDDSEGDTGIGLSGLLDVGIGRIPVSSVQEANDHINKIKNYLDVKTLGDWRNKLCFIADDEDSNVHMEDADALTKLVEANHPNFNIEKIYLDSYTQYTESGGERYPDVNNAINNRVQKGAILINYTGHGGEEGLAHERVVTISEINSWMNFDKLPLFVTATCEFTRFDDYEFTSAGEKVFLNPVGGAIAMFTTARIAYIHSNFLLSNEFYKQVFSKDHNGNKLRLGDISRLTKNSLSGNNKLIFFLMGDPALELAYPQDNFIVTNTINDLPIGSIDTLKALSEATFKGEIQNMTGNRISGFNGYVYPTVYDKKITFKTLDNDGEGPFTFEYRNNIIYKGKASIKNGEFKFSFIVPKDIAMNVDSGKVSYYGDNGIVDAKGYNFDFLVGDIADDYENDITGPEINLYMNDESFVSGGMTDINPRILAKLYDEHGINTATGGVGHDITGVIDDDVQNMIIMNDDYRADADTYKSGTVEHLLFSLEPGEHTLKFKAWDVYNNSSEEFLDFIVVESENLTLERLLNYPNPFTTHTDFYFEHNQIGVELDVLIQIFTVSGKLVKTIQADLIPDGYRAGPFSWNGTDDFGNRIGRGVYVYRVKLRSAVGDIVEKYEKLLILK